MDQTTDQPTQPPSLAISDLVMVLNLIRITAERGAIKAEEMSAVGTLYEKLFGFLQASGALNRPESATGQEQAEATDESVAQ